MNQRIFPGTWCDIAQQGGTTLHVSAVGKAVYYRSTLALDSPPIVHNLNHELLFLRAAGTENGHILVAGKDQTTGDALFAVDGGTATSLGPCHGTHCVSVVGRKDDFVLYVTRVLSIDTYRVNQFGTYELTHSEPANTSQGFLYANMLADTFRDSVPGMVYPFITSAMTQVGQNGDAGPDRLRAYSAHSRSKESFNYCALYQGFAQRPCAFTRNGKLYVAAYVTGGSLFQEWDENELPWGNDAVVIPPEPQPDPDQPFVAKEGEFLADILPIIEGRVATATRGTVGYLRKALDVPGWGEWWSWDDHYIGHLEDASTGLALPDGSLDGYYFVGTRVWMPRRVTTGWTYSYTATIQWRNGRRESFPVKMRTDVGYGRYSGRDVTWVLTYDPRRDGNPKPGWVEKFYFGPTGWVKWESYKEDTNGHLVLDSAPTPGAAGPQDQTAWVEPTRPKPYTPIIVQAPPKPELPPTTTPPTNGLQVVQYLEYKNLQDRLEDTYKNHGGHPPLQVTTYVNPEGEVWREHYFNRRNPQGMTHEAAMRSIESQIDVIEGRPDRWASAPTTPTNPSTGMPALMNVRTDGRWWVDDLGAAAPNGTGALYALDGRNYLPYLDYVAGKTQYVRVFAGYLAPNADRHELFPADARNRLPQFMAECHARGLRVEVSALTDTAHFNYDWHSHVDVIARMNPDFLELANEVQHGSQDPSLEGALGALYQRARSTGYPGPIAFGSNFTPGSNGARADELDPATGKYRTAGGTYNTVHLSRGEDPWYREVDRTREQENIQAVHNAAVANDEPQKIEETQDPKGFAFLLGIYGRGFGLATTFHSAQARDCQPYSGIVAEAFAQYQLGWALMPRARYHFENSRHGSSPVKNASFVEGEDVLPGQNIWRIFCFLDGNTGYAVVSGPSLNGAQIEWQGGWHPIENPVVYSYGNVISVIKIAR